MPRRPLPPFALLAIAAFVAIGFSIPAAAQEPVPGSPCQAGVPTHGFEFSGGPTNGGIVNGMFCEGGTYTGIINFQSSGRVGIGTTSPGAKLDIKGGTARVDTSTDNSMIYVYGGNPNSSFKSANLVTRYNSFYINWNAFFNAATWQYDHFGAASQIAMNDGGISFRVQPNIGSFGTPLSWNTAVTIAASSNVGIGTTSPQAPLQVAGEAIIGKGTLACAAAQDGALRFTSSTDTWEFCNGSAWVPFESAGSSGGTAWTPANLGSKLAAWYDASDATTITHSSGAVSQWRDKSPNTRHAVQATAVSQPLYSTTALAGAPGISFDASNDWFYNYAMGLTVGANISVHAVAIHAANQGPSQRLVGLHQNGFNDSGPSGIVPLYPNASNSSLTSYTASQNGSTAGSVTTTVAVPHIAAAYSTSATTQVVNVDGGTASTSLTFNLSGVTLDNLGIGSQPGGGNAFGGVMSEVILTTGILTTDERQMIEGYLAHKWGLEGSLPSGHPYKIAPPSHPAGCPNIGNVCSDGSVYAGLSPDGNVAMYTTSTEEYGLYNFNNGNTSYSTAPGPSATSGSANTAALAAADSDIVTAGIQPYIAAQYCDSLSRHGKTDWYLPAEDELTILYTNRASLPWYAHAWTFWSSTDAGNGAYARHRNFSNGGQDWQYKYIANPIRCVRK